MSTGCRRIAAGFRHLLKRSKELGRILTSLVPHCVSAKSLTYGFVRCKRLSRVMIRVIDRCRD